MAVDLKYIQPRGVASMWVLARFSTVEYGVTAYISTSTSVVGLCRALARSDVEGGAARDKDSWSKLDRGCRRKNLGVGIFHM